MSTCDGTRNIRAVPRRNQRHERLTKTVVTSPLRKSWPSKPNPIYTLEGLVLAGCGWQINTAFVERLNLDIRQRIAAVGRRVNTLCQGEDGLLQQLAVFQTYHNFVLPHASLRQLLPVPEPTNDSGSARMWRLCTPA